MLDVASNAHAGSVLVVGLGSMGKRRVRNLLTIGNVHLGGYDVRPDRRRDAAERYGIPVYTDLTCALDDGYRAVVISVPPDMHVGVARECIARRLPFFLEASVVDDGLLKLARDVIANGIVAVPSATMRFFPGPKRIVQVVREQELGRPLHYVYHSGQFLPDWHPWEDISEFYVSRRDTGGCREIVPFELTWLVQAFGDVVGVRGSKQRLSNIADIDDVYSAELLHASGVVGILVVDVLARPATRRFQLVGTEGSIRWDGVTGEVEESRLSAPWHSVSVEVGNPEAGYLYPEEPYEAEMRDFLSALAGTSQSYTIEEDLRILRTLYAIEESSRTGYRVEIS